MDSRMSLIFVLCALTVGTVAGSGDYYAGLYLEQNIIEATPMSSIDYGDLREQVENLDVLSILTATDKVQIRVSSDKLAVLNATFASMGVNTSILHNDDLQSVVNQHMDSMDGILESYYQLEYWWDTLPARYREDVKVEMIAYSRRGRAVTVLTIGSSGLKPIIVVVGGIKGRDFGSVAAAKLVIERMLRYYKHDPAIGSFEWVFVLVANPDSYLEAFQKDIFSSKTVSVQDGTTCVDNGVDFPRNFPINFDASIGTDNIDPCSKTYRGPYALSESEVEGIVTFIEILHTTKRNIVGFVELTGYGQRVTTPSSELDVQRLASNIASSMEVRFGNPYTAGPYTELEKELVGPMLSDWALSLEIPHAFTINLRDTGNMGVLIDEDAIVESRLELFEGLRTLAYGLSNLNEK